MTLTPAQLAAIESDPHIGEPAKRRARAEAAYNAVTSQYDETMRDLAATESPNHYILNVPPMGKPRQTQRDKWAKRDVVVRYRAWCDDLRAEAERVGFVMPEAGARFVFRVPMPKSWNKKKRAAMDGQPHQQRPDWDNMAKGVMDALCPDEDSHIWHIAGAEKRWATVGAIEVTVEAVTERAA